MDPEAVKSVPPLVLPLVAVAAAPLSLFPFFSSSPSLSLVPSSYLPVYFTKSAEQGAQTQIFLSASSSLTQRDAGEYFDNSAKASPSDMARDASLASWLWEESERLTGVRYDI